MNEPIPGRPNGAIDPIEYVTDAWLTFVRDPHHDLSPLRDQIEAMLYRFLYMRLGGFFDGFFDYIVREAAWLTLSRLFPCNKKLIAATQSENRGNINAQLMRSIWLALQATMWRTRTLTTRNSKIPREPGESQPFENLRQTITELTLRSGN